MMKILVIGAGPLGSLLAARLHQGGHETNLLARGKRLDDLKKEGVVLRQWESEETEIIEVPITESFRAEDAYELVMVVMRKNKALKLLPGISTNKKVPTFLFLLNNAAGPQPFIDALGKERVVMGFPGAAGYHDGHAIVHLRGSEGEPVVVMMGDAGGGVSPQTERIARELEKGLHIKIETEPQMDAWSKYHVALLFPALAPAFYLCGNDNLRMARTRDAMVLAWRGMIEGFEILRKMGYPMKPKTLKRFLYIPEPIAIVFFKKFLQDPKIEVAMVRHAKVIRDEIQQLNNEFLQLIEQSGVFTPTIRFLIDQFNQKVPTLPEGSRSIPLRWSELITPLLLIILITLIIAYVV
jgi:ketopantoate reductase